MKETRWRKNRDMSCSSIFHVEKFCAIEGGVVHLWWGFREITAEDNVGSFHDT